MADGKMIGGLVAGVSVLALGVGGYIVAIVSSKKPTPPKTPPQISRPAPDLEARQPRPSRPIEARGDAKSTTTPPATRVRLRYEVLLRSRSIHKVGAKGEIDKETLSIAQLLEVGEKAQREDKDLVLRVQGDAKAQWVQDVKRALSQKNIPFSVAEEF
ncbi:MAG: hypothetical protein H6728_05580 [Myxococcales bacterium]|nr:hypothetical protein [Myxococcales bacterium]MCB9642527.1 hypothetical protein [Myxococcales bacterium]